MQNESCRVQNEFISDLSSARCLVGMQELQLVTLGAGYENCHVYSTEAKNQDENAQMMKELFLEKVVRFLTAQISTHFVVNVAHPTTYVSLLHYRAQTTNCHLWRSTMYAQ